MQSTYPIIFSGCAGVMLALASCVLVAPVLAILVAVGCVSLAWVLLPLDRRLAGRHGLGCDDDDLLDGPTGPAERAQS